MRLPGLARALLALLLIALAALPEGGALPAFGGAVWLLAALAVGAEAAGRSGRGGGSGAVGGRGRAWHAALLALAAWFAVQALPAPPGLRAVIAPGQAEAIAAVAPEDPARLPEWLDRLARYDLEAAVGEAGAWGDVRYPGSPPWSPGGVRLEGAAWWAAQWGGLLMLGAMGWRIAGSGRGSRALLIGVMLLGVGEAVFGLANRDGPSTGIGVKTAYLGSATGTFVNRSHFGALLALALGCAWGLAASLFPLIPEEVRRHRQRKTRSSQPPGLVAVAGDKLPRLVLLAFFTAILSVGLVMSRGRGPLLGLAAAGVIVGLWVSWRRRDPLHAGIAIAIPGCGVILSVIAFGVRGSLGRFMQALGQDDSLMSRVQVWRAALAAFRDAPLLGHGPSAFQPAWALHHPGAYLYDFPFAHSGPIQIAVEGGLVGLALLTAGLGALLWGARRLPEAPAHVVGPAAACGAVLLQSLADFPLHIPGVAAPFAALAGLVLGACHRLPAGAADRAAEQAVDPLVTVSGEIPAQPAPTPAAPAPTPAPTPADPAPAAPAPRQADRADQTEQADRADRRAWAALAAVTALAAGIAVGLDLRHPGNRSQRLGSVPAIFYVAAASPKAPEGWLAEAEAASWAMPLDPWAHLTVARGHAALARREDPEAHAFAADQAIARALWLRPRDPRLLIAAAELLLRLARALPTRDAFQARAADLLGRAVAIDGWRAEDAFRVAEPLPMPMLERIAMAAGEDARAGARVRYALAQELARRGAHSEAYAAAKRAVAEDPAFGPGWFRLGEYALKVGQPEEARAAFDTFLTMSDRPLAMEGWALYQLQRQDEAMARFRKATAKDPGNRWAWEGVALISRQREDRRNELSALRHILKIAPEDARVQARIRELEEAQ